MTKTLLVSANTGWNLVNFRSGILRAACDKGWRVIAAVPPDPVAAARLRELGCVVEPVSLDSVGLSPRRDLRTLFQFWRLMRRYRPSHYFSWTPKPNVYGGIAARACGVRATLNISGLGSVFIADSLLTRFVKLIYRFAFAGAGTIFFQNGTDRDLFLAAKLARTDQASVLPGSGINIRHFTPAPSERLPSEPLVFLLIARLLRDKGVEEYAEAAAALKAAGFSGRFQLLGAIGVANPTAITADQLQRWIDSGVIEYRGEADDVRPHIAAADCIVLPSYREGTARVLLEAGAMAKPVVATDVPGCRDPVVDGVTGILCAARSADSLAEALSAMAALSSDQRRAMGLAGRARVEAEYDERIVVDRYMAELER